MPATTASAATGQWANLPANLLRDIAHRLRAASDSVRFDAVCRPWRNALEDQVDLLSWLVAPSEAGDGSAEDQRCRCVFSRTSYCAPGVCVRDMRVACADGTAAWLLSAHKEPSLVDPLTADPLPLPFPRERLDRKWLEHRHRIISDDGAVLLYDFTPNRPRDGFPYGRGRFCASFLSPGDGQWRHVWSNLGGTDCCAAAYYYGYIVCVGLASCHILWPDWVTFAEGLYCYQTTGQLQATLPEEPGKVRRCSYLLESNRRLLLASVLQEDGGTDLSVSLHELRLTSGGEEERVVEWVRTDGSDHYGEDVLFLGFPGSFAMWAEWFGGREVSGGTAYFVIDNTAPQPCSVYRYSFNDGTAATLVETLPPGWHDARCMWFIPAPQITMFPEPDEEQETPAATCDSTPQSSQQLTIYAGDLSPKVDSSQLRDMFSKHGKVARARVAYDKRGRSRGFGFVTMATQKGFDNAMAAYNAMEEPHGSSVISPFYLFVMLLVLSMFFAIFYSLTG